MQVGPLSTTPGRSMKIKRLLHLSSAFHEAKELENQLRNAGISVFRQASRTHLVKTVSHSPGSASNYLPHSDVAQ